MNKFLVSLSAIVFLVSACADRMHFKSMTYVPLYFDTLTARPTGDYTAEAELMFRKNVMVDKEQKKNYKQLAFSNRVQPVMVGGQKQNTIKASWNALLSQFGSIRASFKLAADPTYDLALFKLVEKYPNVDYWTNIRVDREVVGRKKLLGRHKNSFYKNGIERVKITATGIDILSDAELAEIKNNEETATNAESPAATKPAELKAEKPKPNTQTEGNIANNKGADKANTVKPAPADKSAPIDKPGAVTVSISKKGSSNLVTATLQDWENVQFEFDMQGKYTAVPAEIAAQWMKSKLINKSMFLEGEKFKEGDFKFPSNKFEVPLITIGNYAVERVQFTVTDKVRKPTLGKSFFKAFKTEESYVTETKLVLIPKKASPKGR